MTHPYRVIVLTSDKYIHALRPYAYLFEKYWIPNVPVLVAGFSPPPFSLPDNFSFTSLGNFADYPFNRWSDALIKLLNNIPDEVFVLMLEDYWITRQVDTNAVQMLVDYTHQFGYVMKVDLCADRLYAYGADLSYATCGYLDLVKSMPGSPYHMSLMTGVWRKEHLLRHLIPGESPHDVELTGTFRVSHDQNVLILGTRQWPLRHTLGLRGADPNTILLNELHPSDVEEMTKLGYFKPWEKDK